MRLSAFSLPCSPDRRATAAPWRRGRRAGYTLLEIILALSIAALLLAGLYYALYIQTNNTYSGRKLVERTALARAIVSRMQNDILASLGPVDTQLNANPYGNASMSGSSSGTGSTGSGSTSGMSGSSSNSSGSGGSSGSSSSGSASQTTPQMFNLGMQGTSTQLSVYTSRVPREALQALNPNNAAASGANNGGANGGTAQPTQGVSDLRRITFWLSSTSPGGLARQETLAVTSPSDIGNLPPGISDEGSYIIHPEVVSVQFQYYDGTNWQDSWDGTQPGSDGQTPQGPPVAVAITLTLTEPGSRGAQQGGQARTYQYYHVVGIPTANGTVVAANAANAQGSLGSSGSSSSGGN
jgi:prepilin-type N-terminal cleavage/methylation domain-containing protein